MLQILFLRTLLLVCSIIHFSVLLGMELTNAVELTAFAKSSKKVNVNGVEKIVNDALHNAVDKEDGWVVEMLLDGDVDLEAVSACGGTALHRAVSKGKLEFARLLLAKGADVNAVDCKGQSPLSCWISSEDSSEDSSGEMLKLLIANGANTRSQFGEWSVVHWAVWKLSFPTNRHRGLWKIEQLLKHGFDINDTENAGGWTPLRLAIWSGFDGRAKEELISFLLKNGADVNKADKGGFTPLHCIEKYEEPVKELLAHGAKINAVNVVGNTPLHIAAAEGRFWIVRELLKNGATINIMNHAGETPLDLAAKKNSQRIVTLLLESGARWRTNKEENEVFAYADWEIIPKN